MNKEDITYDMYCDLRKELGDYTSKSNLPIELIYKLFNVFDEEMTKYIIKDTEYQPRRSMR